jgi:DNA-binding transcriptional ArsR family regulator
VADLLDDTTLANRAAEVLKAVGHPLRLRIVALLCRAERNVTGLAEKLDVPQAIVSQQLRILRMRGLVGVTRKNGLALYWLAEPHLRDMVACVTDCVSSRAEGIQ